MENIKEWIPLISLFGAQLGIMGAMFAWGWHNLRKDIQELKIDIHEVRKEITVLSEKVSSIDKRLAHLEGYIERDILEKVRLGKPTGS